MAWLAEKPRDVSAPGALSGTERRARYPCYAICLDNSGYEVSLHVGKVYRIVRPQRGDGPGDARVIDGEGEEYLYPAENFEIVSRLTRKAQQAVREAVPAN